MPLNNNHHHAPEQGYQYAPVHRSARNVGTIRRLVGVIMDMWKNSRQTTSGTNSSTSDQGILSIEEHDAIVANSYKHPR